MTFRKELQDLLDRYVFAYQKGDARGCAAVFTPDAELFSPFGPAARGRDEIEQTHAEWTSEGGGEKMVKVTLTGASGDLAWCLAEFSEGSATVEGTSLCVFERQKNGDWLMRMCSLNEIDPTSA